MTMKVCMYPAKSTLGIGRVVDAYRKYLPAYDVEFVSDESQADLVAVHAGEHSTRQPDVAHCHGLYPTAMLDKSAPFFTMNADVIENVRTAHVVTVPSEWVADLFRRDMLLDPVVVPHGVDVDGWPEPSNNGYVLWAKGHNPGVCDPTVLSALADKLPDRLFVTTFGKASPNIKVTGKMPFEAMQRSLACAGIYLGVTKEVFGIQTLEALALGVPVLGYDWGGTADIVTHGYDGYLVEPGDIDGLAVGLEWIGQHRDVLSANAMETARRFSWDKVCEQLADVYYGCNDNQPTEHKVSVVIPTYNYGHCVGNAIESVLNQDFEGNVEVIVVNDGSTDNTSDVVAQYADKVTCIEQPNNGVAVARNVGIRHAGGEFITCLDADDEMLPGFLGVLVPAIEKDRGLGIVYGRLIMVGEDGRQRVSQWPGDFCYQRQVVGQNPIPSACVFRKDAWLRAGGYRSQYTPTEDAELWLRITSVGYDAVKVGDDPVYLYRVHSGSLSRTMKAIKYENDKPWARHPLLGAPTCNYEHDSFPVRNYDQPWVSVIIPVGPGHESIAWRAVDSVWLQSMPYWECIVVNDSGQQLIQPSTGRTLQEAYPFIIQLDVDVRNVSKSRNLGADEAQSDFLVWLDADDAMLRDYLQQSVGAYNDNPDHYVYTDWLSWDGENEKHGARDFDCEGLKLQALHPVTALVPKAWHEEMGGFDEDLGEKGWEDWDYYLKMVVIEGHCGYRVPEALVRYDVSAGTRREDCLKRKEALLPIITGRYLGQMCKGCSRRNKSMSSTRPNPAPAQNPAPIRAVNPNSPFHHPRGTLMPPSPQAPSSDNMIVVIENSGNRGKHAVVGAVTRTKYGNKHHGQQFPMHLSDQRAQAHLYIPVQQQQPAPVAPAMPSQPVAPTRVSRPMAQPSAPPKPMSDRQEVQPYNAEVEGIDISLLKLTQIKAIGFDGESAADAYEQEAMGKARKTVLVYLESQAGEWLEEVDEEE